MPHANKVYTNGHGYVPHPDLDAWYIEDMKQIDSAIQLLAHMKWMDTHPELAPLHHATYDNYKRYKADLLASADVTAASSDGSLVEDVVVGDTSVRYKEVHDQK
jgi:hypothetical protein